MTGEALPLARGAGALVRNSGAALVLTAAQAGSRFAGSLLIAHYLGASQFGLFAVVWAYLELFRVAADFGLEPVLIRRAAIDPAAWPALLSSALLLKLGLAAAASLLAVALADLWGYPAGFRSLVLVALPSLFFTTATNVFSVPYIAGLTLHRIAGVAVATGALYIGAVAGAGAAGLGLVWFVLCPVVHDAATLIGVVAAGRRAHRPAGTASRAVAAELLREARPTALTAFLVTAYVRVGLLLVGMLGDMRAAGNYALATRLAEVCKLVGGAVATSILPTFARLAREERRRDMARLFWALAATLAAPMLALALLAPYRLGGLLSAVFPRFDTLGAYLVPLLWAMVFVLVNMHASAVLSGLGRFWLTTASAAINLAVSLIANGALIPRWGGVGAAWAYLATEAVNTAVQVPMAAAAIRAVPPADRSAGG